MAIFSNGKATTVAKVSFAERLSNVKAMFQTAYNQASALNDEMQKEIENKNAQIAALQSDIEIINVTKKEAEEFMTNISKLI